MEQERFYTPMADEDYRAFLCRIFSDYSDANQLSILTILTDVFITELHGRPYSLSAKGDEHGITVTVKHEGKPVSSQIVNVIKHHIDKVGYHHQGNHVFSMRRVINSQESTSVSHGKK